MIQDITSMVIILAVAVIVILIVFEGNNEDK